MTRFYGYGYTGYTGYGYVTPANGFTIEGWFLHTAPATTWECIFGQYTQATPQYGGTGGGHQIEFSLVGSGYSLWLNSKAGPQIYVTADPGGTYGSDAAWHYFAVRLMPDLRTVSVFIDGNKLSETTTSANVDWDAGILTFGGLYAPQEAEYGHELFNGRFAYLAVNETALTDNRIAEHYAAGSGGSTYYGDNEVTRLNRIYGWAGVPVSARYADAPLETIQSVKAAGANALTLAMDTSDAASGLLHADGQARMVYFNRKRRYCRFIMATLAESTGAAPEVGMQFQTDDTKVFNSIKGDRPYGGTARYVNEESKAEYGKKTYSFSIPITSDASLLNAVTFMAARYGADRLRITGVKLAVESSTLAQYLAETVQLGDVIAFDELPDNSPITYAEYAVESVSVNADFLGQSWALSLELSPNELNHMFRMGATTLGDGSYVSY